MKVTSFFIEKCVIIKIGDNMDDLIELATYDDDDYGLVVQFLDSEDNCYFYSLEKNANGERIYTKFDDEISRLLEKKYFTPESDENYE